MGKPKNLARAAASAGAAFVALAAWGCLAVAVAQTPAQPQPEPSESSVARGERLVGEKCAGCHATGRTGVSPNPKAPPFREVGKLYPPEHLAEALAEGIVTGDKDMPEFKFEPRDVDAIIDYLEEMASQRE